MQFFEYLKTNQDDSSDIQDHIKPEVEIERSPQKEYSFQKEKTYTNTSDIDNQEMSDKKQLKREIDEISELNRMKDNYSRYKNTIIHQKVEIEQLQYQIIKSSQQIEEQTLFIQQIQSQLESNRQYIDDLKTQNEQLQTQITYLNQEYQQQHQNVKKQIIKIKQIYKEQDTDLFCQVNSQFNQFIQIINLEKNIESMNNQCIQALKIIYNSFRQYYKRNQEVNSQYIKLKEDNNHYMNEIDSIQEQFRCVKYNHQRQQQEQQNRIEQLTRQIQKQEQKKQQKMEDKLTVNDMIVKLQKMIKKVIEISIYHLNQAEVKILHDYFIKESKRVDQFQIRLVAEEMMLYIHEFRNNNQSILASKQRMNQVYLQKANSSTLNNNSQRTSNNSQRVNSNSWKINNNSQKVQFDWLNQSSPNKSDNEYQMNDFNRNMKFIQKMNQMFGGINQAQQKYYLNSRKQ